jgi:hypothetical protein
VKVIRKRGSGLGNSDLSRQEYVVGNERETSSGDEVREVLIRAAMIAVS